ncbi:Do family serine endopeptidase [Cytophagaceae bacterium DM2B3-1]|uniref:Do family serine endopeptidase n=1 Tax=Xanthocytophaga flava TaxID=3048013 RepID=A0ABT7CF45_9BACT|nr:Do family serine endopeptidase [Xanthocytophaga flavus]MDJ1472267.1 Do family serine endopeptidase [Xanthocytophaga flavus]MDJ1492278.1 Do family serine endopeptidase [Xanthocytophaga flavus]
MKKLLSAEYAKIFVAAILGSMLTLGGFACFNRGDNKPVFIEKAADFYHNASVVSGNENPQGDFSAAAEAVVPAVVNIRSTVGSQVASRGEREDQEGMDPFEQFFGRRFRDFEMRPQGPQKASGSGVIISSDGYIVTNNHVVENADELEVFLSDKRSFKAKVIGTDPNTDLALIKISANNLPKLAFANSDNVKIGSWAMAVGFPLQLESTVTAGIVSAKGRSIGILQGDAANRVPVESFIQTDAAINPGNSGGALVNLNGDLIGINTAIASPTGSYAGYGFAIPANLVSKVVEDILKYGSVQQAYLGVVLGQVDKEAIEKNGLKVQSGVFLDSLIAGGSAASSGLKENDVILKIDESSIGTIADIKEKIARHRPGDVINVLVNRKGSETAVKVTLKGLSNNAAIVKRERSEAVESLGVEFANLSAEDKKKAGVEFGVKVSSIYTGKLREAGVRPGFIIMKVNNQPVKNVDELLKAINQSDDMVNLMGKYPNSSQKLIYGFEK